MDLCAGRRITHTITWLGSGDASQVHFESSSSSSSGDLLHSWSGQGELGLASCFQTCYVLCYVTSGNECLTGHVGSPHTLGEVADCFRWMLFQLTDV
jgi:hypothetical protein